MAITETLPAFRRRRVVIPEGSEDEIVPGNKEGVLSRFINFIDRQVNPSYLTPDGKPLVTTFQPENHPIEKQLLEVVYAVNSRIKAKEGETPTWKIFPIRSQPPRQIE